MHKAGFFISDWAVLQNLVHFLYLVSNTASVCVLKWKVGCSYSIRNYSITPLETDNLKQCATRVSQLKLQKPLVCRREILKFTTKIVKWTQRARNITYCLPLPSFKKYFSNGPSSYAHSSTKGWRYNCRNVMLCSVWNVQCPKTHLC